MLTALLLALGNALALVGSVQLVAAVDQSAAYLNGSATSLQMPPRIVKGRTMLALRESAALLEVPVDAQGSHVRFGRAAIDTRSGQAWLNGTPQAADSVATLNAQTYVSARLLADALGANISFSEDGRTLTLTALRGRNDNPLAPQARFSTDKNVYAPGERVVYTEYAFDPDGADITARKWTGRQEAFFQAGTYTVSLQVQNSRGVQSAPFSRTIQVVGAPQDNPLSFALKYGEPGDTFADSGILSYPALAPYGVPSQNFPLLFSDSPEAPTQSGLLYQDTVVGRARLLAYHLNALRGPARLYVMARNLEATPVDVRSLRLGETAPTRIEGTLGQVTLMEYFASTGGGQLTLQNGQYTALYVSPVLHPGSGVNLLQDIDTSGRVEVSFLMIEDGLPPTAEAIQQLPTLPSDGKHQRGTFPGAVRKLRVTLDALPARLVIGDGNFDPVLVGVDALTGTPQRLAGNYGVLYDLEVLGTTGVAVALSPRGGLYRGAMQLVDGALQQAIKLPRSGVLTKPDQPALLWRATTDKIDINFIPSSGSNLPISFVFYRTGVPGVIEARKTYRP